MSFSLFTFVPVTLKNPQGEVLWGGGSDGFMAGRTMSNKGSSNVTANISSSRHFIYLSAFLITNEMELGYKSILYKEMLQFLISRIQFSVIKSFDTTSMCVDVIWIIYLVIIAPLCSFISLLYGEERGYISNPSALLPAIRPSLRKMITSKQPAIAAMALISWQRDLDHPT